MNRGRAVGEWLDRWQQGRLGALLSYYGFISLFPLLLVLVTVLGIVLDENADLRDRILDTVYARIPVVGAQLQASATSLESSGLPRCSSTYPGRVGYWEQPSQWWSTS